MEEHILDAQSWLVVVTFMVVIILVIHPVKIPLPIPSLSSSSKQSTSQSLTQQHTADAIVDPSEPEVGSRSATASSPIAKNCKKFSYSLTLDIATAPVIGVLFLLATRSIGGHTLKNGIVGAPESGVEPYSVMILFFALAYICISLDMTGVFQYAAFWISRRGNGGGQRIFLSFFLLSTVMSGLTSNDVVILTMTPFLVYYSHAVDLVTPVAFLMAEIQTANIASMALYIGNITNVVACQAYKVSFLEYSAWMLIPCFASIAACYLMLRIIFRHEEYIPKFVRIPDVDPRSCLVDPKGAIFGLAVLTCSLACLIGTSFAHISVWIVTGPFALLTLFRDIWYDYNGNFKGPQAASLIPSPAAEDDTRAEISLGSDNLAEQGFASAVPEKSIVQPVVILDSATSIQDDGASTLDSGRSNRSIASSIIEKLDQSHSPQPDIPTAEQLDAENIIATPKDSTHIQEQEPQETRPLPSEARKKRRFEGRFPLLHAIAIRMPWAILPFTFSMFIMVEGLSETGWISIFATWFTHLVPNYVAAVYAIGFVSVLLCNVFNNVPMTILVARILQHPNFADSPLATPEVVKGCLFALIVGSNLGACTTLISSLAGLMWDSVLKNKNASVGFWGFFKWNMGVMPVVIFVALSVVVAEVAIVF
ncbi:hypothetical protein BGZ93_006886 [Podila epicladia]|nr:hypothetical protein BGZ92_001809 [Podila epicladia]KAG0094709.1 hypothetical protein BGZ93_006886 [Podila epicladia]